MAGDQAHAGRRFGLAVGGAFSLLALVSQVRGHDVAPLVLLAPGALLLLGALLAPARLVAVERAWMRGAHAMSRVTTPLLLGLVWLLVVTPTALLRRAFGGDPLARPPADGGYWVRRGAPRSDLDRQF